MNTPLPAADGMTRADFKPSYTKWRHGGWYVAGVQYVSGAVGCVSRNYPDRKWRIVCDPRPFAQQPTFATRDEAAFAEYQLAHAEARAMQDQQRIAGQSNETPIENH